MFCLFRAAPAAYGGSQARGELVLQLPAYTTATAMQDPSRVWDLQHRILNPLNDARDEPVSSGIIVRYVPLSHDENSVESVLLL